MAGAVTEDGRAEPAGPAGPAAKAERGPAALRPLRHRNFAIVWTAGLVSNVGSWMETVGVGDLVAHSTGDASWTALVAAAGFLPMGLCGPIGGALADRIDRRRFMVVTTLLQTVLAGILALLAATDHATPAMVTAVVFAAGCVAGLGFPAYQAMMPDLVERDELLAATSLGQAQFNAGRIVGPALAALAISLGSYQLAFTINTVSFGAMLIALAALRLPPRTTPPAPGTLWERIRTGARAARADAGIRSAILLIAAVAVTASPFIALIPAMARVRHDGSASLTSAFVTAQGVGAVIGAIAAPSLSERYGRHRLLVLDLVALPIALALYGLAPSPVLACAALVLVGTTYVWMLSGLGTVVQLKAPADLRARVMSLYFLALGVVYPIAAAGQGVLADHVGLAGVTAGGAALLLVFVALVRAFRPSLIAALGDDAPVAGTPPVALVDAG